MSVPEGVEGRSLRPLLEDPDAPRREYYHHEHSPCYSAEEAMQYLTDGKEKYIYFPTTGDEQLFDLAGDRQELHDLAADPAQADRVATWRSRLVERLGKRGGKHSPTAGQRCDHGKQSGRQPAGRSVTSGWLSD